jgi:hypothetical protein
MERLVDNILITGHRRVLNSSIVADRGSHGIGLCAHHQGRDPVIRADVGK